MGKRSCGKGEKHKNKSQEPMAPVTDMASLRVIAPLRGSLLIATLPQGLSTTAIPFSQRITEEGSPMRVSFLR